MNGLCNCEHGHYVTPWCSLLKDATGCGCTGSVLNLWYKIEQLQEEIEKRSSYLGKFRRTEEAQHLLDLIAMTKDEENLFYPFAEAAMADVFDALVYYMPKHKAAYMWNEGQTVIETSWPVTVPVLNPVTYKKGDWLKIDGELYVALADGDMNDTAGKLLPTEDYRKSIHYVIRWDDCIDTSFIGAIDTAIYEALVARIIYKWLCYSYPDEAPRYLQEYEEQLMKIKKRCDSVFGAKIVNRIPRMC